MTPTEALTICQDLVDYLRDLNDNATSIVTELDLDWAKQMSKPMIIAKDIRMSSWVWAKTPNCHMMAIIQRMISVFCPLVATKVQFTSRKHEKNIVLRFFFLSLQQL